MSRANQLQVCSPESLSILHRLGEDIRIYEGKRTISTASYNLSCADPNSMLDLPVFLVSKQTLVFFELSESKVEEMWASWQRLSSEAQESLDFGEWVVEFVKSSGNYNAIGPSGDWTRSFQEIGVSEDFQNRLMNPELTNCRLRYSAIELVTGSIEARYDMLKGFDRLLDDAERYRARQAEYFAVGFEDFE
jgi:hypothetical protein